MELQAKGWIFCVPEAHEHPFRGPCVSDELCGQMFRVNGQGMIPAGREGIGQAIEEPAATVSDVPWLTVARPPAADFSAEGLCDRLEAEANPQDWHLSGESADGGDADPGIFGAAWAGGQDQGSGLPGADFLDCDLIAPDDANLTPEDFEGLGEVPDERVAIVEEEHHASGHNTRAIRSVSQGSRELHGFDCRNCWRSV